MTDQPLAGPPLATLGRMKGGALTVVVKSHHTRLALTLAALAMGGCGSAAAQRGGATDQAPRPSAAAARAGSTPTGTRIVVSPSRYGPILADGRNHAVYLFTRDAPSSSRCHGACATAWPPVLTSGAPVAAGRLPQPLGTVHRRDGTVQVTYAGHPLYFYEGDRSPGQILCQNVDEFGGTWLVVSPSGSPIHKS